MKNLDRFMRSPCDMLTKAQAAQLTVDDKIEPTNDSQGPVCTWQNKRQERVAINLNAKQPLGISGIYRNHQQDPNLYKYFEPVDIAGFPGVIHDSYDRRSTGFCGLAVGVTDQQILTISDQVESGDPCEILKQVAEMAVTTMSKG